MKTLSATVEPPRIIPCLLLDGTGLVKGQKFKDYKYVGDPINAVNIFNSKEVDELAFLDIRASSQGRVIDRSLVEKIADECYMPFAVGGGIKTVEQVRGLLASGAEKVVIGTEALANPKLITAIADKFGSQSVVVSVDAKLDFFGRYRLRSHSGTKKTNRQPTEFAKEIAEAGTGEILLNSIDQDGMMQGFDHGLVRQIVDAVNVPVIACGGAGSLDHMASCYKEAGATAFAVGSFVVFHGRKRAVLITYPERKIIEQSFSQSSQ